MTHHIFRIGDRVRATRYLEDDHVKVGDIGVVTDLRDSDAYPYGVKFPARKEDVNSIYAEEELEYAGESAGTIRSEDLAGLLNKVYVSESFINELKGIGYVPPVQTVTRTVVVNLIVPSEVTQDQAIETVNDLLLGTLPEWWNIKL